MASIGRVNFPPQLGARLIISGDWSSQCDDEIERGGFDWLELQGAEYVDFSCLVPHAKKITALSIDVRSKSAAGLSSLYNLQALSVSYDLSRDFDFSALPSLRRLNVDSWIPRYNATVFKSKFLESLRIEGYSGADCLEFSQLAELRSLRLAKGSLTTLKGLSGCSRLSAVELSHVRKLSDISELASVPVLRELELSEGLASLQPTEVITRLTKLQKLDISQSGVELEDVSWLLGYSDVRDLFLPIVKKVDWSAVFHSRKLARLRIRSAEPQVKSIEEVLEMARQYGHSPKHSRAFGTKKIPGYFVELETGGNE